MSQGLADGAALGNVSGARYGCKFCAAAPVASGRWLELLGLRSL